MSRQHPEKVSVTFHDVCACFSEEEWKLLHEWQKELYKNIIRDIYQALTSLGPVIAASVFSLRPKENKDVCPMDNRDSERKQSINHFPSDNIANPDVLFGENREDTLYLKNPQYIEGREINDGLSTDLSFLIPDISLRKADEANTRLMDQFHAERGETSTGSSSGFPFLNTDLCWRSEEEAIVTLMSNPGADCGDNITDSSSGNMIIPEVVLVHIKEEEDTYSVDHQEDCERIESITPGTGDERVEREREVGYSTAITAKTKAKENVSHISEVKGSTIRSQVWPESHQEPRGENSTQWESGIRNQTHSTLGQATPKIEESDTNNDCEKRLVTRRYPISHQRIHIALTQKENPYQYGDSEKSLTQKHYLMAKQRKHMEKRSYQCPKCEKKFVQKGNFNMHQRTHTGEKPYQCSDCEKSFRQKGTLVRHRRTHTGERPYQCTDCEKTFSQKHHLVGHQRTHMEQCQPLSNL